MKKFIKNIIFGKYEPVDSYGQPAQREKIDYSKTILRTEMPDDRTWDSWVSGSWISRFSPSQK